MQDTSFTTPLNSMASLHNGDPYVYERFTGKTITVGQRKDLQYFVEKQTRCHQEDPAIINMSSLPPAGFLYNLDAGIRWSDDGEVAIVRHLGRIVGISCVESSDLHPLLSIGGIRCWIDRQHRTEKLASRYLLSSNLAWSREQGKRAMMLTFNHYNRRIYDGVCRAVSGRMVAVGNVWSDWWKDCMPITHQLEIRNTMQWCVLKPIDETGSHEIFNILEAVK